MAEDKVQNYGNHVRIDAFYFYFVAPCLLLALICGLVGIIRDPSWTGAGFLLLLVGVMGVYLRARTYAVKVQDRVVRLETRLRLERLLPDGLRSRIGEFSLSQLIALRFASDEELPELARQVLEEGITDGKTIKQRIKNWQADFHRV